MSTRAISKVFLFALILALSLTVSYAGTLEGSTTSGAGTPRTSTDSALGQTMIFNGDFFSNGVTVTTFTLQDASGNGARFVTPILFEETAAGEYVVRAIGATETVSPNAAQQVFAFGLQNGSLTTTSGNFTFGFIEAAVNSAGTQTTSSTAVVDLNTPQDAGNGVSGVNGNIANANGGNDWVFVPTPGSGATSVALGTTFFIPGGSRSGNVQLNNSALGGFNTDRTYSANANSIAAGVPEPGTLTLFTSGAGLLLAGLLRFRRPRK